MPGPGFLEARRASSQDATRPSDRVAIATVLLGGIIVVVVLVMQLASDRPRIPQLFDVAATSQPPKVQSGHVPTPADLAAPTVASAPRPAPTPQSPVSDAARRHVVNTDGEGVVLRASPRDDDWTPRGFMDGDWVTMLDQPNPDWVLVQGDNGQQGWVPAQYLAP